MKTLAISIALACCACLLAGAAAATPRFGVAEDAGKYADDGGAAVYAALKDVGMTDNRMWVFWDASRPTEIVEKPFLDRALPVAERSGVRVVFSVSPLRPRSITATRRAPAQFVAFLQLLARTYPQVDHFIVGNEPNQPRFWQPQFVNGKPASARAYYRVLALAYDALKAVDPEITVIGVGLSPRGNDNPRARSNISTSPVRFIRDLGTAYRASRRRRPIMDLFGFHSYPRVDTDPLARGYPWPNAGMTNLDRIKQAVWDAFHGTAQPTFAEWGDPVDPDAPPPLRLALDEVGWQVRIPAASRPAYHGRENVSPTVEAHQAEIYSQVVDIVACDPAVASLYFFHLVDEHDLDRFQSGLIRADWTLRPSYHSVKSRIAEVLGPDGVRCFGQVARWSHTETVVGPTISFPEARPGRSLGLVAKAQEEVSYAAGLFPVSGIGLLETPEREGIEWLLERRKVAASGLPWASGTIRAYWRRSIRLTRPRTPGWYVYGVRLAATMNPERTSFRISSPFFVE
jgi:hypothetical protein